MYQYIVAYRRIYQYVLVHTCIYQYVLVHTSMYHYTLDYDFAIQRIYEYVRVQTVPNRLKKGANMSQTCNLLHAVCRIYPFSTGSDLDAGLKAMKGSMNIYIVTVNLLVCAPGA